VRSAECGVWNQDREAKGRIAFLIGTCLLLALFSLPSVAQAELLDRVVASVNNEVITLSELERAVNFNVALGGTNGDKLRAETLEGLINRQLLIQEAYRLKFVEVSDQEIQAEIEKLKNRVGPGRAFAEFLGRLDMTEEQLGRMLGERLLVEKFIEKKIGLFVRVSRDEAQDYFNNHPAEFRNKSFQEVQKTITAMLTGKKLEQQVAQYLAELKSRADIRIDP
jgi:peptidyl-prolyl cis-trans isomerase SurA